jgi:hypothetical protein
MSTLLGAPPSDPTINNNQAMTSFLVVEKNFEK